MASHGKAGGQRWAGAVGGLGLAILLALSPQAAAQNRSAPNNASAAAPASDYASRVVAYIHEGEAITRQDLGEYLIARLGAEKLELLVNRRIIDQACRARGIEVTAAEVEAALANDLKDLNVDRGRFVRDVLRNYRKTLFEWKEDVLRPKLLMAKLCRDRVSVTEEELDQAFDARYGEKVECRMILWPKGQEEQAKREYATLRDSEEAFAVKAKQQYKSDLAASGGKIKPVGRGTLGLPDLEREALTLKPGELSKLVPTPEGVAVLKCDRRLPADTSVNPVKARAELAPEVLDRKVMREIPAAFAELRKAAAPVLKLPAPGSAEDTPAARQPAAPVATFGAGEIVTREELGEFLIARYGAAKLDLLVNRRILDAACKAQGITCTPAEIEAEAQKHLQRLNVDRKHFTENVLRAQRVTYYEWQEDVLRTKVVLGKLARAKVQVTEDDLKKAFAAYYGEKVKCRIILWPLNEENIALREYGKISKSEEAFAQKARTQASSQLAAKGGEVPPFGRHSTGNEEFEREAFSLQPGEVSRLVGTPEGMVVIKCDARIPAEADKKLDDVRDALTREVAERKLPLAMNEVFGELREAAKPRLLLRDPNALDDIASEVEPEISELKKDAPTTPK